MTDKLPWRSRISLKYIKYILSLKLIANKCHFERLTAVQETGAGSNVKRGYSLRVVTHVNVLWPVIFCSFSSDVQMLC
jgi:hypothetical protein